MGEGTDQFSQQTIKVLMHVHVRICPGRNFAMDSLHISIASILTVFNIRKAKDEHGQIIEPEIDYIPGYTR